ncbi:MAG: electron transfer flavoprotein subunit alpha/FixB family protein [Bryobacterales bacterium]|nr:electron transfer flavoprotein subunit alpha/FixB family protein [Bryobacterales bacterium]
MSILVVLEGSGSRWHPLSWEALSAGQRLAVESGLPLAAAVIGEAGDAASKQLDHVWTATHPLLAGYTADGYAAAVEQVIQHVKPTLVLFPHTYQVRDFAPKVATRFGQVLASDVIRLRLEDGRPVAVRQLFQGKLTSEVRFSGSGPVFVSIQAGAYRADQSQPGSAAVEAVPITLDPAAIRSRAEEPFREAAGTVDLTAADIIVSVGRGIREKDNIALVEELAQALGGELAASRPICDNGWLPMDRQVGSSGQTVSPKLYVAVGISGAIQHLVGMKGSKTIVAINKDSEAPIFEVADYGIVGDLFEVVPALVAEIRKAKGS